MCDCIYCRSTICWRWNADTCRWLVAVGVLCDTAVHHHWPDIDDATWVKSIIRPAVWSTWTNSHCCLPSTNDIICVTSHYIFHDYSLSAFQLPFVHRCINPLLFCTYSMTESLLLKSHVVQCILYHTVLYSVLLSATADNKLSPGDSAYLVSAWLLSSCHFRILFTEFCVLTNVFILCTFRSYYILLLLCTCM